MPNVCATWPNNLDTLHALLTEQAARTAQLELDNEQLLADRQAVLDNNAQLEIDNQHLHTRLVLLQEQLNLALARRYAARSEKISPDQVRLFDEAEVDTRVAEADAPGANGSRVERHPE